MTTCVSKLVGPDCSPLALALADKLDGFVRPSALHFGAQDNQSGAARAAPPRWRIEGAGSHPGAVERPMLYPRREWHHGRAATRQPRLRSCGCLAGLAQPDPCPVADKPTLEPNNPAPAHPARWWPPGIEWTATPAGTTGQGQTEEARGDAIEAHGTAAGQNTREGREETGEASWRKDRFMNASS